MKVMIVEGRYECDFSIPGSVIKKLPHTVTLASSIQYIDALPKIIQQLAKHGIAAKLFKGIHSKYPGQVLGCDIIHSTDDDAFLYIGDGLFHPKTFVLKTKKPVHCYSPATKEYQLITTKGVEDVIGRQNAARMRFLEANTVGILVTTKCGQNNMKAALAIKQHLKGKKNVIIFLTDTLDWNDLENYPFVDIWINTMCPRISYDDQPRFRKMVLDVSDVIEVLQQADTAFSYNEQLAGRCENRGRNCPVGK